MQNLLIKNKEVKMNKKVSAFTLAEVLITLGIIGIVAAMTIPTLQANNNKQEYVTRLKKAYTIFNQAVMQMSNDMGCPGDLRCTGLFIYNSGEINQATQRVGDELVKYFKVVQNCQLLGGCFSTKVCSKFDGTVCGDWSTPGGYYRFITADSMTFAIGLWSTSGELVDSCQNFYPIDVCAVVYIDVNGPSKGPNYEGRDIFRFGLTRQAPLLYPYGGKDLEPRSEILPPIPCTEENKEGSYCAARVMEEGWQMNY